jgi:hypothetical protein
LIALRNNFTRLWSKIDSITTSNMNINIVENEDDGPPELVEAGPYIPSQQVAAARKVPITIVTGMPKQTPCSQRTAALQTSNL